MSNRNNQTNTSGSVATVAGTMPANNFSHPHAQTSRVTGRTAAPTVTSNGHAVEVDSDGGVWDTVSGAVVARDKTNLDSINL